MPATHPLSPEQFALLCDVIRQVARGSRLSPEDAEDFSQTVHLRLIERNYAPIAQFAGRSSLRTFLVIVVRRMLLDWRCSRFGKWRPCTEARQHGGDAIELDRLISRDGHPVEEAIAIIETRPGDRSPDALRALADKFSHRQRPRFIAVDVLDALGRTPFADPIEAREDDDSRRKQLAVLGRVCQQLSQDDRRLLRLRFKEGLTVGAIAAALGVPAKPLFGRISRLLKRLNRELTAAAQSPQPLHESTQIH